MLVNHERKMSIQWSFVFYIFLGISISLFVQKFDVSSQFDRMVDWMRSYFTWTNDTHHSLALLTLVDQKKKSFSVAVLPKRQVQTTDHSLENQAELNAEINAILKKAVLLQSKGQTQKAMKLLKQCKSLNPKHPDVLNYYGEGIEKSNVIEAEHHYALALVLYPGHLKATENRRRCQPLVRQLDMKMLKRIEQKREALMRIPEGNAALTRAKLEAYYKHIYHSNGIEGNTMTLSMTRSIVETGMAIGGKSVIEHNEVLGMDAALKYINRTLLNDEQGPVTLENILQIHKRVLGYCDPIEAGIYRETQVYVGDHVPPSPYELHNYLKSFQMWLKSSDIDLLHPIELAALAHYKLVYIHPFVDGNGRTSRLLMNLFLMRAGYPPVIIRKEQRFEYYEMLQTANKGDVRPFIRFVARCTEETLDEYLSSVTVGKIQMDPHSESHDLRKNINFDLECYNPFRNTESLSKDNVDWKCSRQK